LPAHQLVIDDGVPVLDRQRLLAEFGDDPEVLAELKDLFLTHLPELFAQIRSAIQAGDGASLARSAHSLKGAASTYGAHRVHEVCRQLEQLGKQGDLAAAGGGVDLLAREIARVTEAIAECEVCG
jgi:two-component system sensor histidine kinase/response regulator